MSPKWHYGTRTTNPKIDSNNRSLLAQGTWASKMGTIQAQTLYEIVHASKVQKITINE